MPKTAAIVLSIFQIIAAVASFICQVNKTQFNLKKIESYLMWSWLMLSDTLCDQIPNLTKQYNIKITRYCFHLFNVICPKVIFLLFTQKTFAW